MTGLRSLAGHLADLVWPLACAGCGRPSTAACAVCLRGFGDPPSPTELPSVGPVTAAARYTGGPAALVVAWKERGRHDLTDVLAGALAPALTRALTGGPPGARPALVVPVPTSAGAVRRRGAALVTDLARSVVRHAAATVTAGPGPVPVPVPGRPVAVPVLRVARRVRDQTALDAAGRRRNLAGAFAVRRSAARTLEGHRVVVVDDVLTTGATLGEAARALREAGAEVVGGVCLCVTFPRAEVSGTGRID